MPMNHSRGFTLIEMIVAVGIFALVMVLVSGAYLIVVGVNRQAQGIATGIDNLSFALEDMTRNIRTGTDYSCSSQPNVDCSPPSGGHAFYFKNSNGNSIEYSLSSSALQQQETKNGVTTTVSLTDPSVTITSLTFYVYGATPTTLTSSDGQARVTIIVSGTVSSGPGATESFTVETGATMRGSNI